MLKKQKPFLLCFHDLSVRNCKDVLPVLYQIKTWIQSPFSVLVIPDITNATEEELIFFRNALKQLHEAGFELALHGFQHRTSTKKRSLLGKIANSLTNNEAEFAGLSEKNSSILLNKSMESAKQIFPTFPKAFIPPTWYENPFLKKQVSELGLIYENRNFLHTKTKKYFSPAISFAGLPEIFVKAAFISGNSLIRFPFGILRIALHPIDFPEYETKIKKLIESAYKKRKLLFYKDL